MVINSQLPKLLAEYLKDKNAELIIAGNVAIDGGSGQVGPRVAEFWKFHILQQSLNWKLMDKCNRYP